MRLGLDLDQEGSPWFHSFSAVVGSGHASLALREDYIEHLMMVKAVTDCQYVRFHGILHDDMGVYVEDEDGNPSYSFLLVDKVFDRLLDMGVRPFVEFGFMPKSLASGDETVFFWKGNVTPPKSYDRWGDLIAEFIRHCVDRYGEEEVLEWYFEIWNEPNLPQFFAGAQQDYFRMYEVAVRRIKEILPDAMVGGPASAGRQWLPEFVEFIEKNDVPADFISTHNYCCQGLLDESGKKRWKVFPAKRIIDNMLHDCRTYITDERELHYTEWNSTPNPKDSTHDTVFNAAFVSEVISRVSPHIDSMSYWTFSDVFEENGPPRSLFHGGFGLVAMYGIPKPTFRAFEMLHDLGDWEVPTDNEHLLVTKDSSDDSVRILGFNGDFEEKPAENLKLDLELLIGSGRYLVEDKWIDENTGNPLRMWKELGAHPSPSHDDLIRIHDSSVPGYSMSTLDTDEGILSVGMSLPPNSVRFLRISKRA
ncbi:xylan 1,4-beta-xylosidase [Candidatus Hydrogenedentota bacterium]